MLSLVTRLAARNGARWMATPPVRGFAALQHTGAGKRSRPGAPPSEQTQTADGGGSEIGFLIGALKDRAVHRQVKLAHAQRLIDLGGLSQPKRATMIIAALGREDRVGRALEAFAQVPSPDLLIYSAAITACERAKNKKYWRHALVLFDEMKRAGIAPDAIIYNAAISACEKGSQWERALELLERDARTRDRAERDHLQRGDLGVREGLAVGARARAAERDARTRDRAERDHLQRGDLGVREGLAVGARARAAERDARTRDRAERDHLQRGDLGVREGLAVGARARAAGEMRERGIEPDVITYSAAISACEKGSQWEQARALMTEMQTQKFKPRRGAQRKLLGSSNAKLLIGSSDDGDARTTPPQPPRLVGGDEAQGKVTTTSTSQQRE